MGNEKSGSTLDPKVADRFLLIFGIILGSAVLYSVLYPGIVWVVRFTRSYPTGVSFLLRSALFFAFVITLGHLWNKFIAWREVKHITLSDDDSVYLGREKETGKKVHLKSEFRNMHTQLIGTTNAGKTASVIMPWIAQDIEMGRGMIIVDGKSDGGDIFERDSSGAIIGGDRLPIIVNANRKGDRDTAPQTAPPSAPVSRTAERRGDGGAPTAVLERPDTDADGDGDVRVIPAARRPRRTAAESEAAAKAPARKPATKKTAQRTKRRSSGAGEE